MFDDFHWIKCSSNVLTHHHNNSENTITAPATGTVITTARSMAARIATATQTLGGGNLLSINNLQEAV